MTEWMARFSESLKPNICNTGWVRPNSQLIRNVSKVKNYGANTIIPILVVLAKFPFINDGAQHPGLAAYDVQRRPCGFPQKQK